MGNSGAFSQPNPTGIGRRTHSQISKTHWPPQRLLLSHWRPCHRDSQAAATRCLSFGPSQLSWGYMRYRLSPNTTWRRLKGLPCSCMVGEFGSGEEGGSAGWSERATEERLSGLGFGRGQKLQLIRPIGKEWVKIKRKGPVLIEGEKSIRAKEMGRIHGSSG